MHCAFPKDLFIEQCKAFSMLRPHARRIRRSYPECGRTLERQLYPEPYPPCVMQEIDCRDCPWVEYREDIKYCYERPEPCENKDCRYWEARYPGHCVLRVYRKEGLKLVEIAEIMGISKQRAEQLEKQAIRKLAYLLGILNEEDVRPLIQQALWEMRP